MQWLFRSLPPKAALCGLLALPLLGGCAQAPLEAADPGSPLAVEDGWPVATAAEAGFDPAALEKLTEDLQAGVYPNTHAVLIEQGGRLAYEIYLSGRDERWGNSLGEVAFDSDDLHDLRSVSKSVTSLLLGIALAQEEDPTDYAAALARPLVDYFPDLADQFGKGVEDVTLEQALTMTAGLQWNEMEVPYTDPKNDEIQLYYTKDPVALVLARPLVDPPGSRWYYNGGLTQVMAGLIERKTGQPLDDFAEEVLFGPLGIEKYEWLGSGLWPKGSSPSAASGLRLRPRDLAKIGSLMLHQGAWQGRQVVPPEWIALSAERRVQEIPWFPDGRYGFMWYPGLQPNPGEAGAKTPVLRAAGNGGQTLFILPEQDLVITILAGNYNRRDRRIATPILEAVLAAWRGE